MPSRSAPKTNALPLAPHLEEIVRAIRAKVDGKHGGFYDADTIVRRTISRLATLAGTRRLVSHSATFRRALAELQGKDLSRASQGREVESRVAVIARWLDLAHILPPPAPKPEKRRTPPKRIKGVKRIRFGGNGLEEYGVEMNDRLLVAMNGDIRPGELGYFEVHKVYDHGKGTHLCHAGFYFLFERDKTCRKAEYIPEEGVCLRDHAGKCTGEHVGSREEPTLEDYFKFGIELSAVPFGRVVGVERDGQPVETTLPIRPYDGREETAAPLDLSQRQEDGDPSEAEFVKKMSDAMKEFGNEPIMELLRLVSEGKCSKSEILRRVRRMIRARPKDGGRIEQLRERLRELRDEGEAHNESGIFKLECEIYNLEHPEETCDWNDWSAWEE